MDGRNRRDIGETICLGLKTPSWFQGQKQLRHLEADAAAASGAAAMFFHVSCIIIIIIIIVIRPQIGADYSGLKTNLS